MKARKKYLCNPDYAIPPGETLAEYMEFTGLTSNQFSKKMGFSNEDTQNLLSGKKLITNRIASKLETVTKIPSHMWSNLEINYRKKLAEIEQNGKNKI